MVRLIPRSLFFLRYRSGDLCKNSPLCSPKCHAYTQEGVEKYDEENGYGFMFRNRCGGALDSENLADRVIKPVLKANGLQWRGWHAYRRGLATNLSLLGVPDNIIQGILRHENVSTTHRYIKRVPTEATNAMKRLEAEIACSAVVPQSKQPAMVN